MNILHIANNDYDGAGRAVLRLHHGMLSIGIQSTVCVLYSHSDVSEVVKLGYGKNIKGLLCDFFSIGFYLNYSSWLQAARLLVAYLSRKYFFLRYKNQHAFNFGINENVRDEIFDLSHGFDVVVFHSLYGMLCAEDIKKLSENFNGVIIFHPLDMEMITGGCHFNFDCSLYKNNCSGCPQLKGNNSNDVSFLSLRNKKIHYQQAPINWVLTSSFMMKRTEESSVYSSVHTSNVIHMGIDIERYEKVSKKRARYDLGWGLDDKVIMFGCFDLSDLRKGAGILKDAIKNIVLPNVPGYVRLVTFGGLNGFSFSMDNLKWEHLGFVAESKQMNLLYRASDVFASPSLDDIGPTTVSEAFVNDLPVVAFDIGVAPDLLIKPQSGAVIPCFDVNGFGVALCNYINYDNKTLNDGCLVDSLEILKDSLSVESEAHKFKALISSVMS